MPCNGSTGLVTNGRGGWVNDNGGVGGVQSYMNTSDINSLTNSYMDASGANTVYGNPNLPAVTQEQCNSIKCGQDADALTKFACSSSFGAGVWDLCTDPRCVPYRGGSCTTAAAPQAATSSVPLAPLTRVSLTAPIPDITATPAPLAGSAGVDPWCAVNSWVDQNTVLALGVLALAFVMVKR